MRYTEQEETSMGAMNVLIVHGIGWGGRDKNYAKPLEDCIRQEFDRAIKRLKLRGINSRDAQAKHALRFEAATWDPVTQTSQDSMLRVMFGRPLLMKRLRLAYQIRRNMLGLLGDVVAYERDGNNPVYRAIHEEVDKSVNALSEASRDERDDEGYAPLTIIGHSLGSVIASDYVWDHTYSTGHSHLLAGHRLALINMVTMGSPMAVYSLRRNAYGGKDSIRESLDSPIKVHPQYGMWLNIYDVNDAIAFPLEPIESYKEIKVADCAVSAGTWLTRWNLGSHVGYWRCRAVAEHIAGKLALDWARLNCASFEERDYSKAVSSFRKGLKP
jgi:hypothetical protein